MSRPRFAKFVVEARGDRHRALRLYVWNARLCEEFYVPIQFCEVAVRNIIYQRLQAIYGPKEPRFTSAIPEHHERELSKVVREEQGRLGSRFTADDVVANMTFGFWQNLMGRHQSHLLWRPGVHAFFRHLPATENRESIWQRLESLRRFRNAIMHHVPIYDRRPTAEYRNIEVLLSWICPETAWLMQQLANPLRVISRKPRI
jgi:hypothetical protein